MARPVRAGPIIDIYDTTVTLVVKNSPLPGDADHPKTVRAREAIADGHSKSRGSITARMWVYWSTTAPINVFNFMVGRQRDGPKIFLEGFAGSSADPMAMVHALRFPAIKKQRWT
jgi:hypothetical protein